MGLKEERGRENRKRGRVSEWGKWGKTGFKGYKNELRLNKLEVFESCYVDISEPWNVVPGVLGVPLKISCVAGMSNSRYDWRLRMNEWINRIKEIITFWISHKCRHSPQRNTWCGITSWRIISKWFHKCMTVNASLSAIMLSSYACVASSNPFFEIIASN